LPPDAIYTSPTGYDKYDDAAAAWCKDFNASGKTENWAVARDSKANVYGGKYWIGLAPGCN
jgi:hypothetical protein